MSEGRPAGNRRAPRGVLGAALLCAAVVLIAPQPSAAQAIGDQLRGEVAEADTQKDLLSTVPLAGQKTPLGDQQAAPAAKDENGVPVAPFDPASQGATPDDNADAAPDTSPAKPKSIFNDTTDDQADDQTDTAPVGKTRTAQERQQARKKASLPADPVAVRLDADAKKKRDAATKAAAAKEEKDKEATTGTVRAKTVDSEEE